MDKATNIHHHHHHSALGVFFKWLGIVFITLLIFIGISASLVVWKLSPLVLVEKEKSKFFGGLVTVNNDIGNIIAPDNKGINFDSSLADNGVSFGNGSRENKKYSQFYGIGNLELDNCTISGFLSHNGFIESSNTQLYNLFLNGSAALDTTVINGKSEINGFLGLEKSTVKGPIKINGSILAESSTIDSEITAISDSIELIDSTANQIVFEKSDEEQILLLKNSTINGKIEFKSKKGKVILDSKSNIKGELIGGSLEKIT